MRTCQPCQKTFVTWFGFVNHMNHAHGVDRERLWSRANQIGDSPCVAVRSDAGRWYVMVQGSLV